MSDINGEGGVVGEVSDIMSEKGRSISNGSPADHGKNTAKQDGLRTKVHQIYNRWILEVILQRKTLPPSKDGRHIPLDIARTKPLVDERRGHAYISNAIRTARYSVIDFFPKQLWFQFTRLGNFYFLCVGVPQTVPGLSTTGNVTTILPLMFFVLLTIVKEGYDDYKRHRLDKVENATKTTVLKRAGVGSESGERRAQLGLKKKGTTATAIHDEHDGTDAFGPFYWAKTEWSHLKVGDIVKLARDEDVPADLVLLHADGEDGMAYIETMALDGETNLKSKQVSPALKECNSIEGIVSCDAEFVVEDPNADLYKFDGRVTVHGKTSPLTLNEIIYRGCTVRNTNTTIGVVINSGEECKIRMNANRHPRAKKPALEAVYNRIVLSLVVYVLALTAGCSVGYMLWQKRTEKDAWYLTGASVPAEEIIVGFAIQFNNVIPLALYVSLELIKIGQLLMLNSDIEMYDEASDTPARCNTNTILENLGQVGYVFSDKTGTLTENVMKFRKISIAGTSWLHEADVHAEATILGSDDALEVVNEKQTFRSKSLDITRVVPQAIERKSFQADVPPSPSITRRSSSHWRSAARPDHVQPELSTTDLLEFVRQRPNSPFSRRALQFILSVAICHTVLPETRDGNVQFQASSPDELALVEAAQDLGFLVVHRSSQQITLNISNADGTSTNRTYEILDVIEFSSKRKRMSIIVRCPDGRIWLISKGADSMILPRLKLAHLAIQKANEVRQSVEIERALQRKSEQFEPRNSFGGRPSLNIRRSLALDGQNNRRSLALDGQAIAGPSNSRPSMASRSKSFEIGKMTRSEDRPRPPLVTRNTSHISQSAMPQSPTVTEYSSDKFSFLDDPAVSDDATIFSRCFKHLDEFATEGLRTLLFAHKYISETEYQTWRKVFLDASTSLVDRQERIEDAGELIEQNLDLVGASAIEDKLQKGVPETIEKLRKANIKIWMLTGDKRETAINIAHSARLCRPGSDIFILDIAKGDLEEQLLSIREELEITSSGSHLVRHTVVVIDGHTLGAIENPVDSSVSNPRLRSLFFSLIPTIDSVICCRASPAQKALLVRAIRRANPSHTAPLTLAIGDGANDLAMIAEAHVGVGISGREGLQAARVADYSIAQFRFLQRLLLVHGRWNYTRTAKFILCTFWKEMFFYIPTEIFSRYTGYTGTSLYEMWSLTVLNTLFTSLAVILPGIWEKDLSAETLLAVPELYVYGQYHKGLNPTKFLGWMIAAGVEGVLVFFGCWAAFGVWGQLGAHSDNGLFVLGNLVFSVCIMWTNWKLM